MNNNTNKKYDLEDRLIEFAALVIKIAENLKNSRAGNHIAGQIVQIWDFTFIKLWRGTKCRIVK